MPPTSIGRLQKQRNHGRVVSSIHVLLRSAGAGRARGQRAARPGSPGASPAAAVACAAVRAATTALSVFSCYSGRALFLLFISFFQGFYLEIFEFSVAFFATDNHSNRGLHLALSNILFYSSNDGRFSFKYSRIEN